MPTKNDKQTLLGQQVAKIFLAVALAGGVVSVISGFVHLFTDRFVLHDVSVWQGASSLGKRQSGDMMLEATAGDLTFGHSTLLERLAVAAPDVLLGLTLAGVAWLLLGVVRRTQEGDPFTKQNADALTRSALVAVVGGSVWMAVDIVARGELINQAPWDLPPSFTFNSAPVAVAGILLVIAGVFRTGVRLREETEGLV